ncbi:MULTISPECIES: hypothetical protein [unclassified Burkholderia]|uniref:hypothetical protein n=1 Tax=unclassified Burkholderia TaxID=2613784 RepID=UPI0012E39DBF|nr:MULTISPECIES: hypothetical protein [unclassified Burkholderia]
MHAHLCIARPVADFASIKRKYRDAFEMLGCMRMRRRARLHASVVIQSVLDASGQTFEDADGYRIVLRGVA